jgi:hypothetical protein
MRHAREVEPSCRDVNGNIDQSGTTGTASLTGNANARIGYGYDGASQWNGLIDDVRIYNRALSATEIKQLYNAGT